MSDEPIGFDPIEALTNINAATERFKRAEQGVNDAFAERNEAERVLDNAQKEFDKLVSMLKKTAPDGSYWKPGDHAALPAEEPVTFKGGPFMSNPHKKY